MDRKHFGNLIRSMRRKRMFIDHNHDFRQWTRAHLASQSGLTERQVTRIEQGHVVNLYPLLASLASGFDLSEQEKVEFYAQAGHIYLAAANPPDWGALHDMMLQLQFPVYARTPLWDFVAVNSLSMRLWGQDEPAVQARFSEGPLGANMLRVVFDPLFDHKRRKGGEQGWYSDAQHCIASFRMMAFKYGHTRRYHQILVEMQKYPEFVRHWDLSNQVPTNESIAASPLLRVFHPIYGQLEFLSTRLPRHYADDQIEIAVYIPLPHSEAAYQHLRDDIPVNRVKLFRQAYDALTSAA